MYNRKEFVCYINGISEPIFVHGDLTFRQAAMNAMNIAMSRENEDILCVKGAREVKQNGAYNTIVTCENKTKRFVVTVRPNELAIETRINKWRYTTQPTQGI